MNLTKRQKINYARAVKSASAVALLAVAQENSCRTATTCALLQHLRNKKVKKSRAPSTPVNRPTWAELTDDLSDDEFRKIFRMPRDTFDEVKNIVKERIGDDSFRSEAHIRELEASGDKVALMAKKKGGLISGERKLGIALRLLAGASYLDIRLAFKVRRSTSFRIFRDVVDKWLDDDSIFPFELEKIVVSEQSMKNLSDTFSMRASNGHFVGCIGAMDGIALKIGCPKAKEGIANPGDYYCRKGFYALNMQAILDPHKRFLWISTGHIGSCPDSRAFQETDLYKLLLENVESLRRMGYYIVGDSGYFLRSFLLTPYQNTVSKSPRDNFNYYLSNCRIVSECAFGELILRWGIFWKRITYDLDIVGPIVNACVRLHNLIVTRRDNLNERNLVDGTSNLVDGAPSFGCAAARRDMEMFSADFDSRARNHDSLRRNDPIFPTVSDNGEESGASRGRPTLLESELKEDGVVLRDQLCATLVREGLVRRSRETAKTNEYGHVYYM